MTGEPQTIRIMQQVLEPCSGGGRMEFGGCMMASCYHTGSHDNIQESYEKLISWIHRHGYAMSDGSFERYVTDYWTTSNSDFHVTEILVPVRRHPQEMLDT